MCAQIASAVACALCGLRQPSPASRASKVPKRVLASTRGVHEHRLRAPPRSGQPEEQAALAGPGAPSPRQRCPATHS